jgi:hypothetical protein
MVTLVPTIFLAVLAVWWFRSSSILWGNKDKDKAEEAESDVEDSNETTARAGGLASEAQLVDSSRRGSSVHYLSTTPSEGGRSADGAGSGGRGSHTLGASNPTSEGGQSASGGGKKPWDKGFRWRPKQEGQVPGDVEQGRSEHGVGSS